MLIRQFAHVAMTQSFNKRVYDNGTNFKAEFDRVLFAGQENLTISDFRLVRNKAECCASYPSDHLGVSCKLST